MALIVRRAMAHTSLVQRRSESVMLNAALQEELTRGLLAVCPILVR